MVEEKQKAEQALEKLAAGFEKTESGLRYKIIQKGNGKPLYLFKKPLYVFEKHKEVFSYLPKHILLM